VVARKAYEHPDDVLIRLGNEADKVFRAKTKGCESHHLVGAERMHAEIGLLVHHLSKLKAAIKVVLGEIPDLHAEVPYFFWKNFSTF